MFGKIVQNVNQLMAKESTTRTTESSSNNSQQQQQRSGRADAVPPPPPFSFGNDYTYPSLFQEADEMLQVSLLIYTVTDLRTLAKKSMNNNNNNNGTNTTKNTSKTSTMLVTPERILQLPLSLHTCLEMIQENLEQIKMEVGDGNHEMTLSSLQSIQRRCEQLPKSESGHWTAVNLNFFAGYNNNNNNKESGFEVIPRIDSQTLHAYGDENPDTDLVYAVGQDAIRKRITVAFRGSVTPTDFLTDANIVLRQEENILKKALLLSSSGVTDTVATAAANLDPPQGDYIGIHNGFYEYLFKPRNKAAVTKNNNANSSTTTDNDTVTTSPTNKFTEILQHVNTLFQDPEKRRTYKLYVTGHSLGGALATLFAYKITEAALVKTFSSGGGGGDKSNTNEPWLIPTPVTCVSIASPRVGELDFSNAFALLERRGMLRHLRVANHRDPVTLMPTVSGKKMWAMLSPISYLAFKLRDSNFEQRETYRHTGMKLRLFKPKEKVKTRGKERKSSKLDDVVNKEDDESTQSSPPSEKLYDISYSGAVRTATTQANNNKQQEDGDDDDENDDVDDATAAASTVDADAATVKKSFFKNLLNKPDIPEVSFHLGNAYCENLERVKNDLKDLKLNDLYKTKAAATM